MLRKGLAWRVIFEDLSIGQTLCNTAVVDFSQANFIQV